MAIAAPEPFLLIITRELMDGKEKTLEELKELFYLKITPAFRRNPLFHKLIPVYHQKVIIEIENTKMK
jgi:hypothetical protein